VRHQYFIRSPTKEVFKAITESEWLVRWLCDSASIPRRKGGLYSVGWKDGPAHKGEVLDFVPGKRMTLAWSWEGVEVQGTEFKLSVEPKDDGTILKMEHTGFPREEKWTELYGGAEWGWTYFAMNLKSVLETGHDLRSRYDG
jgi:uncharacterized protein YndB with AHSA1/START domain